jgi:hypothetical protein
MSDEDPAASDKAREAARRRLRLAEIFGDVLPDQAADDSREARESVDRRTEETAQEAWLRSQVPPHHGRS